MTNFLSTKTPNARWIFLILSLLLLFTVIWVYQMSWDYRAEDVDTFLIPWYNHILENGKIAVFSEPFSNYNPPYLYLLSITTLLNQIVNQVFAIKLLSMFIVFLLSCSLYHIFRSIKADVPRAIVAAGAIFAVPTVVLNAVCLSQCDALWAAPCVMVVAAAIRRSPVSMLIWCGVAVAVKLQAIFIAPFALGALLSMRPKPWHFSIPLLSYVALLLPALAAGWPISDLATIYFRQTEVFESAMSLAAPNIWLGLSYFQILKPDIWIPAAKIITIMFGIFIVVRIMKSEKSIENTILLSLLSALATPYLLPSMHERYFFLADILAFILVVTKPSLSNLVIAGLIQIGSFCGYFLYLTAENSMYLNSEGVFYVAVNDGHAPLYGPVGVATMTLALIFILFRILAKPAIIKGNDLSEAKLVDGIA